MKLMNDLLSQFAINGNIDAVLPDNKFVTSYFPYFFLAFKCFLYCRVLVMESPANPPKKVLIEAFNRLDFRKIQVSTM
jgi:hypothetical protein